MNAHFFLRERCPVCEFDELSELFRCRYTDEPIRGFMERLYEKQGTIDFELLEGADFALRACPRCELIFQEQLPDAWLSEIVYEQWNNPDGSRHRKEQNATRSRGRTALEIMSIIDFFGRDPRELRFMDFGMGWGAWIQIAKAFGLETYGVENSMSRVEHARNKGLGVTALEDCEESSFDFINTQMVFEHLFEPLEMANRLGKLLAPGGILKVGVPNGMRARKRLAIGDWTAAKSSRRSLYDVEPLQHVNCFVNKSLLALGAAASLSPVKIPVRLRYKYMPTWEAPKNLLRRTVGQHYRAVRGQTTTIWFRRTETTV
jgi:2-polyprenyl-3-methyl-5-hydroxy-6-metoxy-1,4-benzoquinol methylase